MNYAESGKLVLTTNLLIRTSISTARPRTLHNRALSIIAEGVGATVQQALWGLDAVRQGRSRGHVCLASGDPPIPDGNAAARKSHSSVPAD
jgi:hypothetical protein